MNSTRPGDFPGVFTGMGNQEVTPSRLEALDEVLAREYTTHLKMERHLWVVLISHRGTDKLLDAYDAQANSDEASPPILDADTLMGRPGLACYVCGVAYEPRLRRRKCAGENDEAGRM